MIHWGYAQLNLSAYSVRYLLLIFLTAVFLLMALSRSKPVTLTAKHTAAVCGQVVCRMNCKTCEKCSKGLPCTLCLH